MEDTELLKAKNEEADRFCDLIEESYAHLVEADGQLQFALYGSLAALLSRLSQLSVVPPALFADYQDRLLSGAEHHLGLRRNVNPAQVDTHASSGLSGLRSQRYREQAHPVL